jgi:hypothetical protein
MQRHYGPVCADSTFMCCMCFEKIALSDAYEDDQGASWDCCKPCGEHNKRSRS